MTDNNIVKSQENIIWLYYSSDNTIQGCNQTKVYGYSIEDLLGKSRSTFIQDPDKPLDPCSASLATIIDKNQIHHKALILRYPIVDALGKVQTIVEQHIPSGQYHAILATAHFNDIMHRLIHDVKKSLRHILTYNEMLNTQPDAKEELREKWKRYITTSNDQLMALLDGLSKYLNITCAGNVVISLRTVLKKISDSLGVAIECKDDAEFRGSENQIRLALEEIVKNSIEFKDTKRELQIQVEAKKIDSTLLIKVKDNGIGIDPEDHQRVFEIFEKGINAVDHKGVGFGFSIARKIIEFYNGNLWIESSSEKGTIICISLPEQFI